MPQIDVVKPPMMGILTDGKENVSLNYSMLERLEDRGLIRYCGMCRPEDHVKHEAGIYHPNEGVSFDLLGEVLASDPNLGILEHGRLKIWISMEYTPDDSDETFDVNSEPVDILSTDDLARAVLRWNELVSTACITDRLTLEDVRETIELNTSHDL